MQDLNKRGGDVSLDFDINLPRATKLPFKHCTFLWHIDDHISLWRWASLGWPQSPVGPPWTPGFLLNLNQKRILRIWGEHYVASFSQRPALGLVDGRWLSGNWSTCRRRKILWCRPTCQHKTCLPFSGNEKPKKHHYVMRYVGVCIERCMGRIHEYLLWHL